MPVFTLTDNSTGRHWHWKQLAGVSDDYKKTMDAETTSIFAKMVRKHKGTCQQDIGDLTYTVRYRRHGGARTGAGRKSGGRNKSHIPDHLRRVTIGCRLPQFKVDWIKRQPGTTAETIERAVDTLMLARAHKSHKSPG